ncbi:MAG: TldD/PmbA family protein [Clostridia bacterium]|nr:TldD/PmbA family protein [Clostridia bacterium]
MTFSEFRDILFKLALEKGCESAEVYASSSEGFSVTVLDSEINKYSVEQTNGLNLRVLVNGRNGYAYTEVFEDPEELVRHAIDNAAVIESTDVMPMQGACEYPEIPDVTDPLGAFDEKEKIELARRLEKDTLAFDSRVTRCDQYNSVNTSVIKTHIHNTLGLAADSEQSISYVIVNPILREGEEEHMGFGFKFRPSPDDIPGVIKESVENALLEFNASPVDSGEYRILLRNDAAADLIASFFSMFSAESVQKGLSLLNGKLGETIAAPCVSIVDDPFLADNPRAFDGEGVPSEKTDVIKDGVLASYLYNLKTALKDGVKSTSNAGRPSVASPVGIAPSNFYITAGEKSFDELKKELGSGLIITELSGLHAGLNPVSGDFSLIAKGQLVENGEAVRSVDQITCAGNFLTLMHDIEAVGNDIRWSFGGGFGRVGSPCLLIKKVVVSGK